MHEIQQAATDGQWARYTQTRSRAHRNELVVRYCSLVNFVVRRTSATLPQALEHADLVSYGVFGLIEAIERFEPERGFRFETYAIPRIRGAIIDGLRSDDWVPRSVRAKARLVDRAYRELEGTLRRPPTDLEVATDLGLSEPSLRKILAQTSAGVVMALDEVVSGGRREGGVALIQTLADQRQGPITAVEVEDTKRTLLRAINALAERERTVLFLYYYEGMTLAEIGRALAVSESRICQIHTKTLVKLRGRIGPMELEVA